MSADGVSLRELYVGGLPIDADEQEVEALLAPYGQVRDLVLIKDRETGRSRGFGFLKLPAPCVQAAVDGLDGAELRGHRVRVNEARDKGAPAPRRLY